MSMFNDIIWRNKDNETEQKLLIPDLCLYSQKDFQQDVGHSSDLGQKQSGKQSDPCFAPAKLLIMTPTSSIEIPAQENLLQKHKERVERLLQQNRVIKILY